MSGNVNVKIQKWLEISKKADDNDDEQDNDVYDDEESNGKLYESFDCLLFPF